MKIWTWDVGSFEKEGKSGSLDCSDNKGDSQSIERQGFCNFPLTARYQCEDVNARVGRLLARDDVFAVELDRGLEGVVAAGPCSNPRLAQTMSTRFDAVSNSELA